MNYADLATEAERQDAKQWLAEMLDAVTAVRDMRRAEAEVTCLAQGWRQMRCGVSVIETPLCLAGKTYATGLGTHADSRIRVRLPAAGKRITGLCGVDNHDHARRHALPITFAIGAGNRRLWTSEPRKVSDKPARFAVDLGGAREFELIATSASYGCAPANWADLKVELKDGRFAILGEPERVSAGFCFTYGGSRSTDFLDDWKLKKERKAAKAGIILHRITRTDPATGLAVICEIKEYTDFPVIEWGLRLKNASKRKTPILENVRSLDISPRLGKFPYLNHWTGDYAAADGYEPFRVSLAHGEEHRFAPQGGRPTNRAWPYYNLEYADSGRGLIAVVGWSGQWAARFQGLEDGRVRIDAGQELTHFALLPGEEVRTPLSVLLFWRGDTVRSQNLWRRWMMACNMPRPGGKPVEPFHAAVWGPEEMHRADEASQLTRFDRNIEEGIRPDVWWMDAGWYPCNGKWPPTGTWEVDRQRFPRGIRHISEHVQKQGTKSLLWFEPERVTPGTWLDKNRPEWLLSASRKAVEGDLGQRYFRQQGVKHNKLLDLGHPAARKWLVAHYAKLIVDEKIDIYRQDFNFEPLPYWRAADARDRQGITEIRYVEGYLAFWQELRRRFPAMLIDSCASGGRRNDLETMRLAVPLTKTDFNRDQPTEQAFHYSLYSWLPFFASGVAPVFARSFAPQDSALAYRTSMAPCLITGFDMLDNKTDFDQARRYLQEWRQINHLFSGDYYPITPFSRDDRHWIAWQFHRPDQDEGMIQAFRRKDCPATAMLLPLRGLDPQAAYVVTDMDQPDKPVTVNGSTLQDEGLRVAIQAVSQAVVIVYRRSNR